MLLLNPSFVETVFMTDNTITMDELIKQDPLAGLIDYTLNLTEKDTHLTFKALKEIKRNILIVINCLQYIEINLDTIAACIEAKAIPYASERDRKNGVLRDLYGTSFHVANFENGEIAQKDLAEYIQSVKFAITEMYQQQKLTDFIKRFEYNQNVGCLEARTEKPLTFAAGFSFLNLDHEMQHLFEKFTDDVAANYQAVYNHFKPLFNQTIVHNNTDIILTKEILDKYMEDLGQELNAEPAIAPAELFKQHQQKITVKLGQQGMVQIHVNEKTIADELVSQLKNHYALQNTDIHKCKVNPIDDRSMFRLTKKQYNIIFGQNSYENLKPAKELTNDEINALHIEAGIKDSPALNQLIAKYDLPTLNKVLLTKGGNYQSTLLSKIGLNQSETIYLDLIEKIDIATINEFIVTQHNLKWNPLHTAARHQSEKAFITLIDKTDRDALNKAIIMRTDDQWNPLHTTARHQSEEAFIALIDKTDIETINNAIVMQDNEKWNPLHLAARYQSEKAFIALIDKADVATINNAIVMQNNDKKNSLHIAARNQSEKAFIALIKEADVNAISNGIVMQGNDKWNPLHTAARFQSEKSFITLIDKADTAAINNAIVMQANDGRNSLHIAAQNQSEKAFLDLIVKADVAAINNAIVMQDDEKWNPLHTAARNQSEKAFITLIGKADAAAINKAIVMQTTGVKWNPLLTAARLQSEKALLTLIDKTAVAAINDAIVMQTSDKWNSLHTVARHQSEKAFIALIDKADVTVINKVILMQTNDKWNSLHIAARNQSEKAFITLINKIDIKILDEAIVTRTKTNNTAFEYIIESQSEISLHETVKLISQNALITCLMSLSNQSLILLLKKLHSSHDLKDDFINKLDKDSLLYLLEKLENYSINNLPLNQSLLLAKTIRDKLAKNPHRKDKTFETSEGTEVSFDDINLIEIVKQKGFASYYDVTLLLEYYHYDNRHILIDIIKELDFFQLLFKGGLTQHQSAPMLDSNMLNKINNYEVLYKVIPPDDFDKYIASFNDYSTRPNILRKKKPNATHKFFHLTGEIKEYQAKSTHSCDKQSIKKNSTTLLSPELVTPVFGEQHQDGRPLVGLLFDFKQCIVKAMLKYDRGTIEHGWVGTKKEVEQYKKDFENLNYTDLEEFKKAIQHNPRLNEVLAEIPKEAIIGIFMRNTTLKARETALEYASKVKATLNLDLPIYHYDKVDKTLLPCSNDRIEQHIKFYPIKVATAIRDSLLKSSYHLKFFGGKTYISPDKSISKILPQTAYEIITKLDTLLAKNDVAGISTELANIETLLNAKLKPTFMRTDITVNSYNEGLKRLRNM